MKKQQRGQKKYVKSLINKVAEEYDATDQAQTPEQRQKQHLLTIVNKATGENFKELHIYHSQPHPQATLTLTHNNQL